MTNSIDLIPPPFTIGSIEIQQVVEMQAPFFKIGDFLPTSDSDKVNALKPQFEPWALCPETGKLVLAVQTYVVRTSRHTILIDTCVGCDKFSGIPDWHMRSDNSWLSRMASVGVAPESVDYVFCTHMHGDHVGWNTLLRDGRYVPTFPNAKYIFAKQEIDFQSTRTEESRKRCYQQSILPVLEAGQAQLVDSDFALDDEVWLVPTPGHTPGHVAVHLKSAGMEAVMIGDALHSPLQCVHPEWSAKPDSDPIVAAQTRASLIETCVAQDHLVLTSHFPLPSIGKLTGASCGFGFTFGT